MKHESDLKPKNSFEIENVENNRCEVVFFDLNSIEEEERTNEDGSINKVYLYYSYRKSMSYSSNLKKQIEDNYETLLAKAKEDDYNFYAKQVREKRNTLLKESDKEMAFDRLGLELPENISMTNLISTIKEFSKALSNITNSKWAKYRQELRDISKQEGFPYNVTFPAKPEE